MLTSLKKVLVVAPHPDDEILGCGGTIKKLINSGIEVNALIVTRGKEGLYPEEKINNVRKEALNAHRLLGITHTRFLNFPAPDLCLTPNSELSMAISEILIKHKTDTIFVPHRGDIHLDHKAVFYAALVAARPVNNYVVKRVFSYETLSETEWAAPYSDDAFIPDIFVNISDVFNAKLEAFKCYKSQVREFPNPRSLKAMEAQANLRGSVVGFTHAEAFRTIRAIVD